MRQFGIAQSHAAQYAKAAARRLAQGRREFYRLADGRGGAVRAAYIECLPAGELDATGRAARVMEAAKSVGFTGIWAVRRTAEYPPRVALAVLFAAPADRLAALREATAAV